ncbi:MAG: hypothetical protein FE043_00080 [Thermoplasmata archaeon]|nr:MAG: hypothetical protein FE043_00080 [Thermoplasmata archaeon]
MKGIYVLMAVLLITPYVLGVPAHSEQPSPSERATSGGMPSLENISLFIDAIPYVVGNITFGVEKNITMELAIRTGNTEMLKEKNQPWIENAMLEFYTINRINVSESEMQKFVEKVNALPEGLKNAIALLIYAVNDATLSSRDASKALSEEEIDFMEKNNETKSDLLSLLRSEIMGKMTVFPKLDLFSSNSDKLSAITHKINSQEMAKESLSLFRAVRYALPEMEKYKGNYNGTIIEDPSGGIIVGGSGKNEYEGNYSLIIDLGGDDLYKLKGASRRAALTLDISGNDTYRGKVANSFLGINMLIDISGNDLYDGGNYSLSYSCGGLSLLFDLNGNDAYSSGDHSQGSADAGGMAFLADICGRDSYTAKSFSEGFSNGNSFSALIDISGDDAYNAVNHSQGSADAGGMAFLLDFMGNDRYLATKNSQGEGEGWANGMKKLSAGVLADFSGNDIYRAEEFSQGFGQTAGAGILADFLGNDAYFSKTSSQACSKFFGIAFLMDINGENSYHSKDFSKGYEYSDGISVMFDGTNSSSSKVWQIMHYISQNKIAPLSTFIGALGYEK